MPIAWFETPVGRDLLQAEADACRAQLGSVFGSFGAVFSIGGVGEPVLRDLEFSARHVFAVDGSASGVREPVCAVPDQLPIASETLRLVVVQHALEAIQNPAAFLAECERVLAAGGTLAVLGLNPRGRSLRWRREPPPWVRRWWTCQEVREEVVRSAFRFDGARPVLAHRNWWERVGLGWEDSRAGAPLGLLSSGYLAVFTKPRNGARVIPLGKSSRRRIAGVTGTVGSLSVRGGGPEVEEQRRVAR
ncbi:MAG: methyltransferase domain-containing protein [Pseudomonadota bacterium]